MDLEKRMQDCTRYSEELGKDYRLLYQMKEAGADQESIRAQKAKIKSDKRRLKNVIAGRHG